MTITLAHYLTLSGILLAFGLCCLVTRRNAVAMLMGIELILNAAILNLVAFSRFGRGLDGQIFALFGIVLAAAEAVVALAIVLQLFRAFHSVDTVQTTELKE